MREDIRLYKKTFKAIFNLIIPLCLLIAFIIKLKFTEVYPVESADIKTDIKFKEVSQELGLIFKHVSLYPKTENKSIYNRSNLFSGIKPSISVFDINRDGYLDVYVVNSQSGKKDKVFINNAGKSFSESEEYSALLQKNKDETNVQVSFFDFNNDGYEDALIARYGCHSLHTYDPNKKDYVKVPSVINYCSNPWHMNVVDLDKDTYLDVVFANYFPPIDLKKEDPIWRDTLSRGDDLYGGQNHLLRNINGSKFVKEYIKPIKYKGHSTAIGVSDIDKNGWPDLLFTNDYTYDRLYLNNKYNLEEVTFDYLKKEAHGFSGMGVEFTDYNEDLYPDVYISNLYEPPYVNSFNRLWINQKGKNLSDESVSRGVNRCGWSWGGKFADFDNDGDLDLVVGNGQFRGDKAEPSNSKNLWFSRSRRTATNPKLKRLLPQDGDELNHVSYSGFQKACLFEGISGGFKNVAESAGFTSLLNNRVTLIFDFDNDGKVDIIMGNYNDFVTLYRNESIGDGHWLGVDLRNSKGSIAIGAEVILKTVSGRTLFKENYPLNGFGGQNDWRLHFGLGDDLPKELLIKYRNVEKVFKINEYDQYIKVTI